MEKINDFLFRPGNLTLSVLAFAGLALLAAVLWTVASGYVLLLLIPALGVSFFQMVVTPIYGLRMNARRWTVLAEDGDRVVPFEDIAHLRFDDHTALARPILVLRDGGEVAIPVDDKRHALGLIRAATDLGVPVRSR